MPQRRARSDWRYEIEIEIDTDYLQSLTTIFKGEGLVI
jgi:hypothetical protein